MKNMIEIFERARSKKKFYHTELYYYTEFKELLTRIQLRDPELELDWDDGAGESWARLYSRKIGIDGQIIGLACMINSSIGVAFVSTSYDFSIIKDIMGMLEVVFVDNYRDENWFIDVDELKEKIPEICWNAPEHVVNRNGFSLDDLYFATV